MRFEGKVVVVTRGTSGIGRESVIQFASEGAKVVFGGRRQNEGDEIVSEVTKSGGTAVFVKTDVTNEAEVKALVETAVEKFGKLDVAFNNAGVEQIGAVQEFQEEEYRKTFDVNVLGVFLSQKYEIPAMLKSGGGVIVNTSSVLGHVGTPGAAIYTASKHAVEGITRSTALEFAQQGIRVNAVAPGPIETAMIDRFAGESGSEGRKGMESYVPVGRLGMAEEVAKAVLYLASDDASFTTGVSLPVDGAILAG
ncbi:2,5-dichloro-2,5-cyclohexadiene-1,4-diol dehydrogenase [Thalassoglobus neptunius]|uniref:2,5-dichloro-2,5-cyclohexadiene-1,4-diol dehydrogenase n=1 Tax=Thalassoglobus neptunius TaxID=1938619 RepID=A0A5C5W9B5_9PLAN|nr:glucose 1-dehydrogenase [Thalassoglobus neptunius]TWT47087.1 2,5-dichloro-2,5-cyclohexadiene-1,4-diol dehydrogenase [Thalassoglobus neptunius]